MKYTTLAIENVDDLVFGKAVHPLPTRSGMTIGGGAVYPELNFTLPGLEVRSETLPEIQRHYRHIVKDALERAAELYAAGVVLEFELLPPMTEHPDLGMAVVEILLEGMETAKREYNLPTVLRCTPNDNREFERPPLMRRGRYWDAMLEMFDRAAEAGSELLSIESVGGKELHDDALVNGDLRTVIFALCTLGVRDMEFLWDHIVKIAQKHNVHAAGDTACGFGNTAMVLAERRMIPRVFAAVVRAITAVRSLVAYERGAVGPGKDCGYENPILKAITGFPMSMEGRSAACAHASPMGNLSSATCDLWSNESVQNIKLLGGMAPTVSMEQLIYDCRMMNQAASQSADMALQYRDLCVHSDERFDPQAFIISPASSIRLAQAIVGAPDHYHAGIAVAREALAILREAVEEERLDLPEREVNWLDMLEEQLDFLPDTEDALVEEMLQEIDRDKCLPEEYGIAS